MASKRKKGRGPTYKSKLAAIKPFVDKRLGGIKNPDRAKPKTKAAITRIYNSTVKASYGFGSRKYAANPKKLAQVARQIGIGKPNKHVRAIPVPQGMRFTFRGETLERVSEQRGSVTATHLSDVEVRAIIEGRRPPPAGKSYRIEVNRLVQLRGYATWDQLVEALEAIALTYHEDDDPFGMVRRGRGGMRVTGVWVYDYSNQKDFEEYLRHRR